MLNNEEQNGKSNRRDPEYRVNEWDEMNGEEDKFVQSAIQEEFNNPVIEETILKFNKIANEEEKET
ncbi:MULTISPECIES: hypothetical protein [Peribacillus]|uniref:hypothetical protein n=1 Tax=Peribacillus TaxID=2675229 RepID=UPI0007BEB2E2|nr:MULTISPECIES: hypothetical protein [Peribacillus]MDP9739157.1 hypothetical protein [Bacillus sp. B2I3]PHD71546.1 hypothetical protein COF64_23330 [Bacillus sp. AFS043905]QNK48838.1 hypothetical protein H7F28_00285 [Brevibacterium sp. PAMC23299]MCZ0875584.1 hypothetical protein [Peribacillus sp. AS_2]MDG4850207.1 hypothetical protein [Peribacillus frigoritolerans]